MREDKNPEVFAPFEKKETPFPDTLNVWYILPTFWLVLLVNVGTNSVDGRNPAPPGMYETL